MLDKASATVVDWHLKVKDTEQNAGLTKNFYIRVSMQKLSSNHKIIVKVQQILGILNEINSHTPFDPIHPKIIKTTFSFPEFAPTCKRLIHSIYSFLQPILESCNKTAKKLSFFINLFWRYGWLKDPKI